MAYTTKTDSDTDTKTVEVARKRFTQGTDARAKQLKRELADLKFFSGEQWPADIVASRAGQQAMGGLPAVPARPCLTVNRLIGPVRQVLNEYRSAEFAVSLTAADDFGDLSEPISELELTIREGLIRRLQRNSGANSARYWAFARGVIAGTGWYRIVVRQVRNSADQELALERIYNQNGVVPDPASVAADGSDMRWCFIGHDLSLATYKAEYGEESDPRILEATTDDQWRSLGDDAPTWFSFMDDGTKSIRVAEYYYIEPDGVVKHCHLNGLQILRETEIPYSPWIPVLKYIGEEVQPYDGEWRAEGMVRPSRDSQQASNFMISAMIERVGLTPLAPWLVAEGQIEGYEKQWNQATTRVTAALPYKTRDLEGNPVGPPQRTPAEANIQAMSQSLVMFNEAIQTTSLVPDPAQGRINPSLRSAATVRELVEQSDQGTSNYTQNMVDVTMLHEARILNAMLPIYSNRPGRLVSVITGVNETKRVMLGGAPADPMAAVPPDVDKILDFTENAQCNIAIKIVKNFDTRRQEESAMLGQIIQHNPEMFAIYGPLWAENLDVPGHQKIADLALAIAPPPVQAVMRGQQPPDPQAQAAMQQMQAQLQAATRMIGELEQKIAAKATEKQFDLQESQIDNQTKLEIAKLQSATQIEIASLKATNDQILVAVQAQQEQFQSVLDAIHEAGVMKREQMHERETQVLDHAAAAVERGQQHAHESHTQGRDHAHEAQTQQRDHKQEQDVTIATQAHERTMQREAPKPEKPA